MNFKGFMLLLLFKAALSTDFCDVTLSIQNYYLSRKHNTQISRQSTSGSKITLALTQKFSNQFSKMSSQTSKGPLISIDIRQKVIKYYGKFTNFPTSTKLIATDYNRIRLQYTLQAIYVKSPSEHKIYNTYDPYDKTDPHEYFVELQFIFQMIEEDFAFKLPDSANNYTTAAVSIIFTNRSLTSNTLDYMPDGTSMLAPFFPYRYSAFTDDDNVQIIEANLHQTFKPVEDIFHQWFHYKGRTTISDCRFQTNWYVNEQKFHVSNELIDRYRAIWQGGLTEDSPYANKVILDANNRPTQYNHTNDTNYPPIMKICYSNYEETRLRENYALWLWCVVLFGWWVIEITTENDTDSCFMKEMENNRWTQLPFYSMYNVNSDIFYTKLSRYMVWLLQFGWNILILSLQYGQFYREGKYGVRDAIIIWCAVIAMVTGWPIGYFFGSIMYHARQLVKSNFYWKLEYKKIQDKTCQEAIETKKQIEDAEDRIFTYYFLFYFLAFFLFMSESIISIWQNIYLSADEQNYWVASIFLLLFMDMFIFDVIAAFLPGPRFTKYRGYYYDFEVGHAFKKMEEY